MQPRASGAQSRALSPPGVASDSDLQRAAGRGGGRGSGGFPGQPNLQL